MQLFAFQVSRSSDSETDRSSHHYEGEVRLGREALRRRVQELGIASRGSVDLVEGLETNQKDGEEREYLHKTREARLTRQRKFCGSFNDVYLSYPELMSQQSVSMELAHFHTHSPEISAD